MNNQIVVTNKATAIDALLEKSQNFDQHKADFIKPVASCKFDEITSRLIVPTELFALHASAAPMMPTDWAWRQMFQKLGNTVFGVSTKMLPFDYLMALKPELRAFVLNDHLQNTPGEWFIRAYDDACRAVLSSKYAPISNTECLSLLQMICASTSQPHAITKSCDVTADSLNVRVIWQNVTKPKDKGGNSEWGIGTYIGNGETGNRKLRCLPMIKRISCDNSIIVNKEMGGLEMMHRGAVSTKRIVMKSTLMEILPFAAELLERMIEADGEVIEDFVDVLQGLSKQYAWNDDITAKIAIGTEGRETRAGLVNGISFAAHSIENPDDRADLEVQSGSILLASNSVFHRAAYAAQHDR